MPHSQPIMFGQWLKRRRKALLLTQAQLAQHGACALITLKKLEAGDLRPSHQLAEALAAALSVPGHQREAFVRFARGTRATFRLTPEKVPATVSRTRPRRSKLPAPLTAILGREAEVAAGVQHLRQPEVRLLTVVGPPGAGKTRLCVAIAEAIQNDFANGVCWVELAPLTQPTQVTAALARALEVREAPGQPLWAAVLMAVQARQCLLVLDNFEHLLPAAALVHDLLSHAPGVKALATSRQALGVYGEHELPLAPLKVPDATHTLTELRRNPAVRLFVQRARALQPAFTLTTANAPAIAHICNVLDGLPLAIEMAAARTRWATPEVLQAELARRLEVLEAAEPHRPVRQRTLRGAIEWSYQQLTTDERRAFARLAVFAGGCEAPAAHAVLQLKPKAGHPLAAPLEALVAKSLLQFRAEAGPRLIWLETLREYAAEALEHSGEAAAMRERHAAYFLQLAQQTEAALNGAEQAEWLRRLDEAHGNFSAALAWCAEQAVEQGLQIATALQPYWQLRGLLSEGQAWFDVLLAQSSTELWPPTQARALCAAGAHAAHGGDYAQAINWLEESLALARKLADEGTTAHALYHLAGVHLVQNQPARARESLHEAAQIYRRLADENGLANTLNFLGQVEKTLGQYANSLAYFAEALSIQRTLGNRRGQAATLNQMSTSAYWMGDYARAEKMGREGLRLCRELGLQPSVAFALNALAMAVLKRGGAPQARRYLDEALEIYRTTGSKYGQAIVLMNFGLLSAAETDVPQAVHYFGESLTLADSIRDRRGAAYCLEGLGVTLAASQPERAAQLLGAAERVRQEISLPLPPIDTARHTETRLELQHRLGTERLEALWQAGHTLPWAEVLALSKPQTSG